ncbi:MAG: hypothetical protein HC908_10585 [Calothrix sp. SM1_7_51]|nr:hypothetical protein [Calothrix sp. SM1_7_51]
MDFKCPFYHENADGKPTVNAPCKFDENPYRKNIMFCTVCGQSRDLRFVGWRPNILLMLMLLAAIFYVQTKSLNRIVPEIAITLPQPIQHKHPKIEGN